MKEFSRSKHFHLLKFLGFYTSSKSCFQSFEEAVQHFERLHDAPRAAIHKSAHFTKFNTFLHLAFKNLFSPQWNSHFRSQCALFGLIVYRYTRWGTKVHLCLFLASWSGHWCSFALMIACDTAFSFLDSFCLLGALCTPWNSYDYAYKSAHLGACMN